MKRLRADKQIQEAPGIGYVLLTDIAGEYFPVLVNTLHQNVIEVASKPTFVAATHPNGTIVVVENEGVYQSNGTQFIRLIPHGIQEVPAGSFADPEKPTLAELNIWLIAQTTFDTNYVDLWMATGAPVYGYTEGSDVWGNSTSPAYDITGWTINGTFYAHAHTVSNGTAIVANVATILSEINADLVTEGYGTTTLDSSDFLIITTGSRLGYTLTENLDDLTIEIGYTVVGLERDTITAATSTLASGGDEFHPSFKWSVYSGTVVGDVASSASQAHPPVVLGIVLPIFDVDTHPVGLEFIIPGGSNYISDGTQWLYIGSSSHPDVTEVLTLPVFSTVTHLKGTVVVVENIGTYISDGVQWVRMVPLGIQEVPNTAFVDKYNPTELELRQWLAASSGFDKSYVDLYMLTDVDIGVYTEGIARFEMSSPLPFSFTGYYINVIGNTFTYDYEVSDGATVVLSASDRLDIIAQIHTDLASLGFYNVVLDTTNFLNSTTVSELKFTQTEGDSSMTIKLYHDETGDVAESNTIATAELLKEGDDIFAPSFKWSVYDDVISGYQDDNDVEPDYLHENQKMLADVGIETTSLWLICPKSIYHKGITYVVYNDHDTNVRKISAYDHATDIWTSASWTQTSFTISNSSDADYAHCAPSMYIDDEGFIHIAYGGYSQHKMYYIKSTNARDITAFGTEIVVESTVTLASYPTILENNGVLILFYRGDSGSKIMSRAISSDGGATWTNIINLNNYYPYYQVKMDNTGRVHLVWHAKPSANEDLYYMYSDDAEAASPTWKDITGATVTIPLSLGTAKVFDSVGWDDCYLLGIDFDKDNNVQIIGYVSTATMGRLLHFEYDSGWQQKTITTEVMSTWGMAAIEGDVMFKNGTLRVVVGYNADSTWGTYGKAEIKEFIYDGAWKEGDYITKNTSTTTANSFYVRNLDNIGWFEGSNDYGDGKVLRMTTRDKPVLKSVIFGIGDPNLDVIIKDGGEYIPTVYVDESTNPVNIYKFHSSRPSGEKWRNIKESSVVLEVISDKVNIYQEDLLANVVFNLQKFSSTGSGETLELSINHATITHTFGATDISMKIGNIDKSIYNTSITKTNPVGDLFLFTSPANASIMKLGIVLDFSGASVGSHAYTFTARVLDVNGNALDSAVTSINYEVFASTSNLLGEVQPRMHNITVPGFTDTEEAVHTLGAADAGKVWLNETNKDFQGWDGFVVKKLSQSTQVFTNLDDHFTLVNQWRSGDVATLLHIPEDIKYVTENVIAVSHRGNVADGPGPITGDTNFGGIIFYDVTDKSRPVYISQFKDTNLVGSMDMKVVGNYLYNVSLKNARLFILDISDIYNPVKIGEVSLEASPTLNTVCYKMDITDNGKYLVTCFRYDTTPTVSKILAIDITDKFNPTIVSNVTHANADWLYYLWARKDKVFVTYYGGGTDPNQMAVYDIDLSTGALSLNREINGTGFNGVQAIHVRGKDVVMEWQGDLSIFTVDPYDGDIVLESTISTNTGNGNRISYLSKNDVNIFAIADYSAEKVQLICMNNDLTAVLGTGVITNVADFETVQTLQFMENYLYVGNRLNSSAMQVYHFDYNSFAKERNDYR